ncbi:hypothetical protein FRB94_012632 [Tulasnella sp. JGI-2019a]|nr:hypothetical protein FRB93_001542 [Tulasnella sp. JGI-2019a]KAG9008995.1 hypothetical protein FRB94_012632 [Tulasnella sp. JGI-2019a]KAG9036027.1 hypothetical protein FRB95_010027 [Tulasnella sp. JGI-2019a]
MFLLLITAVVKTVLTAWTFGMNLPAGIFLPTIAIGAAIGRSVGIFLQELHRTYPTAWIFTSCPPEGQCIYPGFYAVVGAAALLGGVTRMTVSLVVILFELTGALSHVLPIMLAVMSSKFVGDYFGKGVYDTWIAMHGYPYLPASEFREPAGSLGETAASVMTPAFSVTTINATASLSDLDALLNACQYDGFPVLDGDIVIGFVTRYRLRQAIDPLLLERRVDHQEGETIDINCAFIARHNGGAADLSSALEKAPMQIRPAVPLQVVVSMFQKMSLRYVMITTQGRLAGLLTKRDIVRLVNRDFGQANALSNPLEYQATTF